MCGLCGGVSTELFPYEQEFLQTLLILNTFRGSHSTGMFDVLSGATDEKTLDASIWKTTQNPVKFATEEFTSAMRDRWKVKTPSVIAMHTRYATRGGVVKKNSHPFNFYPIIGMHNGTLNGRFRNSKKYDTDSEALYYNISKHGLEEALEFAKDTTPAYALVWIDYKTLKLHLFRNTQRPLHYTKQGNSIYWSSEAEDILYAGKKHKRNILYGEVKMLTPNKLYTLDLTSKNISLEESDIKIPVAKVYSSTPFRGVQRAERQPSGGSHALIVSQAELGSFHKTHIFCEYDSLSGKWYTHQQLTFLERERERKVTEYRKNFIQKNENFVNAGRSSNLDYSHEINGRPATKAAWEIRVKDGCCCCGHDPDPDAPSVLYWVNDQNYLCPDCQDYAVNPEHFVHQQFEIDMKDLEEFCVQRWQHAVDGYPDASFKRKKDAPANSNTATAIQGAQRLASVH